jgi:ketosteroid isomerase-like protein
MMRSDRFRAAVEQRDRDTMLDCMAEDAVLHSPVTFKPFEGRDAISVLFGALLQTFEDFHYTDSLKTDHGDTEVLVFKARVGDREIEGVDLFRFDRAGRIDDLTVFVRPLSGVQALGEAVRQKLGI